MNDIKKSFITLNIIYLVFFIIGILISSQMDNSIYKEQIFNPQAAKALPSNQLFWDILKNNMCVGLKILAGTLSLGIVGIGYICFNGTFFGIVSGIAIKTYSISYYLKAIAFHGVFEIIALTVLSTAGIIPLIFIKDKVLKKDVGISAYIKSFIRLALVGLLLILLCAFIEAFISKSLI